MRLESSLKAFDMEQLLVGTLRPSDMPNQEEFKNLIVEPADIRTQSCSWESSKRIEVHVIKTALKQQADDCTKQGDLGRRDKSESSSSATPASSNSIDTPESLDYECEVITFVIGATNVWDPSKPMPRPQRYVRKGVPQH